MLKEEILTAYNGSGGSITITTTVQQVEGATYLHTLLDLVKRVDLPVHGIGVIGRVQVVLMGNLVKMGGVG